VLIVLYIMFFFFVPELLRLVISGGTLVGAFFSLGFVLVGVFFLFFLGDPGWD
jgi:hypothetical protein